MCYEFLLFTAKKHGFQPLDNSHKCCQQECTTKEMLSQCIDNDNHFQCYKGDDELDDEL